MDNYVKEKHKALLHDLNAAGEALLSALNAELSLFAGHASNVRSDHADAVAFDYFATETHTGKLLTLATTDRVAIYREGKCVAVESEALGQALAAYLKADAVYQRYEKIAQLADVLCTYVLPQENQ